ncbi:5-formyltetrahydrofolate cyclo-ligase [Blochmannia endosymbiont of Camponotus (Colobopsis) obliquus]|uniref:5-formyltetrahydrofolate cyclo-ligase n=1 Tax=Blochmannia endosymbiont of Camponotus (Colobopsis) obliquus TaxID=1505597 RepID=UPI00061A7B6B|nr:5-formyltetrahydrofolate cyclo-ligase [Blochmannia endosymbiont of Camponotus (Colobopsis) obliquus]AKC60421.1 Uncharacterized protein YgfA [Blochmannia endosymbiont of Camponotus (Colobopsis) obliquus]
MNKYLKRNALREHFRSIRRKQTTQQKNIAAHKITKYIINSYFIKQAKTIALFMSFNNEINTNLLINKLLQNNKKIFLPVVKNSNKSKNLIFSEYTHTTPLIKNQFNIQEPQWNQNTLIDKKKIDILFVPLIAFDQYGNRLGSGGGFYDIILKNWQKNHTFIPIGLAYDCQLSKKNIPTTPRDIALPEIITPSYHWIWHNKK